MSNQDKKFKRIFIFTGLGLVGIFILMQFIPVSRENPAVTQEIQWNSAETQALAEDACYDCHSNQTVWPWYSYVAPVSWRIAGHVNDGRRHLNFSEWDQPNADADEIIEVITSGEMPLRDYLLMHPEARLTAEGTQALVDGLEQTLANDPPIERQGRPRRD
ncbi:MAG: heme-binding domain-containing protein [Anaerolineae bacterium]|nr:heme-binding domain-containing protein [Anaerolineae bacterium]